MNLSATASWVLDTHAQVAEAVQHQNIVGASRVSEGDQSYVVDRRNPAKHLECIKYIKPCR